MRPHYLLRIPVADVHKFHISALVLMDHIWLARNKLVFEAIQRVPLVLLKLIKISTYHHLDA